ncbi:hypothetical protein CcI49_29520 [Frankia sp. CcI49]|uniref:Uncharacterized protein n=1 Tax=Parafrankia irregularis TaxID=795642 RepID=A0A0S4QZ87_9ACTN|nr:MULTISPECIES: hypothetical protein [Frankiaceae]KPM53505.1 hypothetical protein ACG83_22755 [Frankia sp. R43]EFC84712.1 hypothetical protein FrEUN1fDRAFT_2163 [Parafrankia sp. EUN1f]MBE3203421.1 hypothetical protein [Parafrankia sp. CH37]ONH54844.1 hypothetical protein CcI49_29520 [Frankia sp. CcI49]CUU60284.1 hypothetical protein Ga0074812_13768 [Parafrankia irregularis]
MLRRGNRPGRLAKKLIRQVGDADIALAGAETRPKVLKSLEEAEVQEVRAAVRADARTLEELIAELRMEIDSRAERRERRTELIRNRVEQGRLWRTVGIQERIPLMPFAPLIRTLVLTVLASLDFFVFAEAYGVLTDAADYGVSWFLGGILGIAVFIAGMVLAHAIKGAILARAQVQLLKAADAGTVKVDAETREQLVTTQSSALALALTSIVFLLLSIAGIMVRIQGAATDGSDGPAILFTALIPFVAVVVELSLHDPTERDEPMPNFVDRRLERRLAKAERRLRIVAAQVEAKVAKIEKLYRVEEAILDVEQRDMGLRHTTDLVLGGGHQIPAVATNGRSTEADREHLEKTLKMARRA